MNECVKCRQALLLIRPDREVCEGCRLNPGRDTTPTVTPPRTPVAPTRCAGCHIEKFGLADGLCLSCRLGPEPAGDVA